MPPHQHRLVVGALAFVGTLLALLIAPHPAWPAGAAGPSRTASARSFAPGPGPPAKASWRWPLRGDVVGRFRFSRRAPFRGGQRRGVDLAAAPGTVVRAACSGRVVFAGAVPRRRLAVTLGCGSLRATFLGLGRLAVRSGAGVARGSPLGTLGPAGRLRLGARRAGDRHGYLDPLALMGDDPPLVPPVAGRARRAAPRRAPPRPHAVALTRRAAAPRTPPTAAPVPAADRPRLPWPAYPALALVASALPVGGLLRRRRRRGAAAAQPAHDSR
jgi:Peptidase family M23